MKKLKEIIKKQGFTLVELIIVIAIIAVLAVAAFMMLTKWLGKSRDSRRLSDMGTIKKSLEISYSDTDNHINQYPLPTNYTGVQDGTGNEMWYLGVFGLDTIEEMDNMQKAPQDPSDNSYYRYATTKERREFQIGVLLEDGTEVSMIGNVLAGNRVARLDGNYDGYIHYASGSDTMVVRTQSLLIYSGTTIDELNGTNNNFLVDGVDLNTALTIRSMVLGDTTTASEIASGLGIDEAMASVVLSREGGITTATDDDDDDDDDVVTCPTGFILVPGNNSFPYSDGTVKDFCVAKYEMSYDTPNDLTTDSDRETDDYLAGKADIISKVDGYAIAEITQQEAIDGCRSMGAGYHLITNNEWMTIARNIESTDTNWSNGTVGDGNIRNGISNDTTLGCSGVGDDTSNAEKTGWTGCGTTENRNKHTLSNGEEIWDFAGNVREFIDRSNNTNITIAQDGSGNLCGASGLWSENGDPSATCVDDYGPIHNGTNGYTTNIGMGYVWNSTGDDKVFVRGGYAGNATRAGIYTFYLSRTVSDSYESFGFRCAK